MYVCVNIKSTDSSSSNELQLSDSKRDHQYDWPRYGHHVSGIRALFRIEEHISSSFNMDCSGHVAIFAI